MMMMINNQTRSEEELDVLLTKIKNRKAVGLYEIPPEIWKTREFDKLLVRYCNPVYSHNTIERGTKGCILPFPKNGDVEIAKNYHGIILASIVVEIYNAMLLNRIQIRNCENSLNNFRRNRSTSSQILKIRLIFEQKSSRRHTYLYNSPKHLTPYPEGRCGKYF